MKRRTPSRQLSERRAKTNRLIAKYHDNPEAVLCPVPGCGAMMLERSLGQHRQSHIRRGDLPKETEFPCRYCGKVFATQRPRSDHLRYCPDKPRPGDIEADRHARYTYVTQIARLPYRQFVEEMRKPWTPPPRSRTTAASRSTSTGDTTDT